MSKYLNNIFVNHIPEGLRVDIDTGENQAIILYICQLFIKRVNEFI